MANKSTTDDTERPENWPESFSAAGESPQCPHQMTWDSAEGRYICLYGCGRTAQNPPESAIEAREEFQRKKEERSTNTGTDRGDDDGE